MKRILVEPTATLILEDLKYTKILKPQTHAHTKKYPDYVINFKVAVILVSSSNCKY